MIPPHSIKTRLYSKGLLPLSIILFSGALMIAHGLRMIIQGVFYPTMTYQPNLFDLFFDWMTLCVLGVFVFCFAAYRFYQSSQQLQKAAHQLQTKTAQ
jgi:hypothetical protein